MSVVQQVNSNLPLALEDYQVLSGERGIRTPGALSDTQHFQCCTIGHSAISPSGSGFCSCFNTIRFV